MTSSGNIRNELVYVANHNKHLKDMSKCQVSYGKLQIYSYAFPCIEMKKCIAMVYCFITIDLINETRGHNNVFVFSLYQNEKSIVMTYIAIVYCYGHGLLLH